MPWTPVRVPTVPEAPVPLMERLRRMTLRNGSLTFVAMLMLTPLTPEARIEACAPAPSMVMDLVMVMVPKPPESSTVISPLMKVLEIAPAKVLQGAVRLHGLTSSPTPETQVRVACAWAGAAYRAGTSSVPRAVSETASFFMLSSPYFELKGHDTRRIHDTRRENIAPRAGPLLPEVLERAGNGGPFGSHAAFATMGQFRVYVLTCFTCFVAETNGSFDAVHHVAI